MRFDMPCCMNETWISIRFKMGVWISYVDRTGRHRKRCFRDLTEAHNFATNPPKGVAQVLSVPQKLQAQSLQRMEGTNQLTGLLDYEPYQRERVQRPPTPIDCQPIQQTWTHHRSRLSEYFDSADEAAVTLIERYEQGWAINTLAREFHAHRDTIKNLLRHNNIALRTRRFRNLQNARPDWEEAFSKPTPAALYWAGFLMADGSIVQRKGEPTVICRIGVKDSYHIQALCVFAGRGKPLLMKVRGQAPLVGWEVISQRMADDLARWGIVPRKGRHDDTAPNGAACMSIDFWRGMIDGDGSIGWSGASPQIKLTGRRGISEAFIKFIEASIPLHHHGANKKLRIHKYAEGGGTKMILNGQNAVSLCELLYAEVPAGLYLLRKREAAIEIVDIGRYRRRRAAKRFL